jgi:NAD(P)-dependent dehydrogenase (short-subunit alcohol dehydrogenase family)
MWPLRKEAPMPYVKFNTALIVGAGSGLSAALARVLAGEGIKVALAARSPGDLAPLAKEIGGQMFTCDATKPADVEKLFTELDGSFGAPEIVIYNVSYRTRGPIIDLDPVEVEKALMACAYGGFLVGQQAARRMLPKRHGTIVFTGASASVKGYAESAPFAMGKFALRGLAQSMARELHPQGVHVAHVVVDGGIRSERRAEPPGKTASLLNPSSIAASYLHLIHQPHSAWSWELELRPWVEKF